MNTEIPHRILNSDYRTYTDLPGNDGSITDALNFGFSYVECQDFIVEYVLANPDMMKKIFKEVSDAEMDPDDVRVGKLWTADLVVSKKVKKDQIVFSNGGHTAVLFLDTSDKVSKESNYII